MAEDREEWHDAQQGFMVDASMTNLFAATANTIDRVREEFESGRLTNKPLLALIFTTLDTEGNVTLFQVGDVHQVIGLASEAAHQAAKIAGEWSEEEGHDHGQPSGDEES